VWDGGVGKRAVPAATHNPGDQQMPKGDSRSVGKVFHIDWSSGKTRILRYE